MRDSLRHMVILLSLPRVINPRENFLHLFAYIRITRDMSCRFDVYFLSNATSKSSNFQACTWRITFPVMSFDFSFRYLFIFYLVFSLYFRKERDDERNSWGVHSQTSCHWARIVRSFRIFQRVLPGTLGSPLPLIPRGNCESSSSDADHFHFLIDSARRMIGSRDPIGNNFTWLMNAIVVQQTSCSLNTWLPESRSYMCTCKIEHRTSNIDINVKTYATPGVLA